MIRPIGGVILVGAMVTMLALVADSPESAVAQEVKAAAPKKVFARESDFSGCISCHASGFTQVDDGNKSFELVTKLESKRWAEKDLHSTAWRVLVSPLGVRMSELLNYDVSKAAACLTCHAVDGSPSKSLADKKVDDFLPPVPKDADPAEVRKSREASLTRGVSCEGCHGNASEWHEEHAKTLWRKREPDAYKEQQKGLVDLRNAERRATKCASCHIGNASEGKLVTHEMYAAGHPPLPAFELATFSRDEPAHYMPPSRNPHFSNVLDSTKDKDGKADRDLGRAEAWRLFHFDPEEIQSARYAAIGSVVNLREYLKTLAQEAGSASAADGSLDWTHFNCSACHHDLKYPSQRQQVGYLGKPGRLFPRMWSVVATRAILEHARTLTPNRIGEDNLAALKDMTAEFEDHVEKLLAAFDKQQYGSPKDVQSAATRLENWCDRLVKILDRPGLYHRRSAEDLTAMLQTYAASEKQKIRTRTPFNDYDTAQHLFWGWSAIRGELSVAEADRSDSRRMKTIAGPANEARMLPLEWATVPANVGDFEKLLDIRARWQGDSVFLKMPSLNLENTDESKEIASPRSIQELSIERSKRKSAFDSLKFVGDFKALTVK